LKNVKLSTAYSRLASRCFRWFNLAFSSSRVNDPAEPIISTQSLLASCSHLLTSLCSFIACADLFLCCQLACLIRSLPLPVFCPVLPPPCILHLSFDILQFLHGIPLLVLVLHSAWGCLANFFHLSYLLPPKMHGES
jgi:hypothetical protein